MQIVLRAKTKCMRRNKIVKGRNEGLRGKIKGTKAYDEKIRLRKKINGADSAKGKIKCIREKIDCEGENQGLLEEIKGTKAKAEKRLRGEYKVQNVPKGKRKSEGEKQRIMEEK